MKKLLRWLVYLLIFGIVVSVCGYFLAKKYEPQVKEIIIAALNKQLESEVTVEDINFSFFDKFPYASLRFSNLYIPENISGTQTAPDTLIFVKDLYLQIALWDFIRGRYTVTEAEARTGVFRMKIFADGTDNYHFWKNKTDSTASAAFNLEDIELRDIDFSLAREEGANFHALVKNLSLSGNFGEEQYQLRTDASLHVKSLIVNELNYISNKEVETNFTASINTAQQHYQFSDGSLKIEKLAMDLSGSLTNEKPWHYELSFGGKGLDMERLRSTLPENTLKTLENYDLQGRLTINGSLSGGEKENLTLKTDFTIEKGRFTENTSGVSMRDVEFSGNYEHRNKTDYLNINSLSAKFGPGHFTSSGRLSNFKKPLFDLQLEGEVELAEVKSFLNLTNFEVLRGKFTLNSHLNGELNDQFNITESTVKKTSTRGRLEIRDGALQLAGHHQLVSDLQGEVELKDNDALIHNLRGMLYDSDFLLKGKLHNALAFLLLPDQKLTIEASLKSENINLNEILKSETTRNAADTLYQLKLPQNLALFLQVDAKHLEFRRFRADNIRGSVQLNARSINLDNVAFNTASGQFLATARIVQKNPQLFAVSCSADLTAIQIDQLFYEFENFGQDFLVSTNLSGLASANVSFSGQFNQALHFDYNSIVCTTKLKIDQGRLKDLEALRSISDYIRHQALLSPLVKTNALEKSLSDVTFSTLENDILIKDQKIQIPRMDIRSSAIDLNISGTHYFDNRIDYQLNFRLADLLTTGRKKSSEFGEIVDDGTGLRIFMKMYGTVDKPEFAMDRKAIRQKREAEFKQETQVVKSILKKEFGLFKSDTTLQAIPRQEQKAETKFEIKVEDFKDKNFGADDKKKKSQSDEFDPATGDDL